MGYLDKVFRASQPYIGCADDTLFGRVKIRAGLLML